MATTTTTDRVRMDYVFIFSERREDVARFYRDTIGVPQESAKDDANWFRAEDAHFVVHDRDDQETAPEVGQGTGFVLWFRVADVRAAYERARAAGFVVGRYFDAKPFPYFFARDPEGRYIGVGSILR